MSRFGSGFRGVFSLETLGAIIASTIIVAITVAVLVLGAVLLSSF